MRSSHTSSQCPFSSGLLSDVVQDIPVWAKGGCLLAALGGVVVIVVASLTGGRAETIRVDKLLHCAGYGLLALLLVLGLRPKFYLVGIVLLALVGLGVEYLQPLNGRTFDPGDIVANISGIIAGGSIGLVLRISARAFMNTVKRSRIRASRRSYGPGTVVLRQGARLEQFIIIERGRLQLSRDVDGLSQVLGVLGPGDVVGLLAVLQSKPQLTTVEAVEFTTVFNLDKHDLIPMQGGEVDPLLHLVEVMGKQLRELAERATAPRTRDD